MNKKIATAAVGIAALFFGSGTAFALTETATQTGYTYVTQPVSPTLGSWQTYWEATTGISRFDTMGGSRVLDSISINLTGTWADTLTVTNNQGSAKSYAPTLQGEFGITTATAQPLMYAYGWQTFSSVSIPSTQSHDFVVSGAAIAQASVDITGVLAANVASSPSLPSSGFFATPAFDTALLAGLFTDLVGTGSYTFGSYGSNDFVLGGQNNPSSPLGTVTPTLQVVYTYHNASVPEASTLALLVVGVAGLVASRRRVSKIATV